MHNKGLQAALHRYGLSLPGLHMSMHHIWQISESKLRQCICSTHQWHPTLHQSTSCQHPLHCHSHSAAAGALHCAGLAAHAETLLCAHRFHAGQAMRLNRVDLHNRTVRSAGHVNCAQLAKHYYNTRLQTAAVTCNNAYTNTLFTQALHACVYGMLCNSISIVSRGQLCTSDFGG